MENLFAMDKSLMRQVIDTLKTLDVRGFDSMDKLVGCVMLLEKGMNPPKTETTEDTIESKPEGKEIQEEGV